jgi:hypothetical protein
MILTADEIEAILRGVWPGLREIWQGSTSWRPPGDALLRAAVLDSGVRELERRPVSGECDFFALQLHAAVRRATYLMDGLPWAIGSCYGTRMDFAPFSRVHACNIVIREDRRVLLIEPQTYQMLVMAGPIGPDDPNHVFYVNM